MDVSAFAVIKQTYKKFVLVVILVSFSDFLKRNPVLDIGVNRGKNSAVYGEKVGNKGNCNVLAAQL